MTITQGMEMMKDVLNNISGRCCTCYYWGIDIKDQIEKTDEECCSQCLAGRTLEKLDIDMPIIMKGNWK